MNKVEPIMRQNLVTLAVAYCAGANMTIGSLSRKAHSDPLYFAGLASGKVGVSGRAYDKIIAWFDDHWPEGLERPSIQELPNNPPFPLKGAKNGTTQRQQEQNLQAKAGQGAEKAQGRRSRRRRGG